MKFSQIRSLGSNVSQRIQEKITKSIPQHPKYYSFDKRTIYNIFFLYKGYEKYVYQYNLPLKYFITISGM